MAWFDFLKGKKAEKRSGFKEFVAQTGGYGGSFPGLFGQRPNESPNTYTRDTLSACRATARRLARDNPYVSNALEQCRVNTVGSGIRLQLRDSPEDQTTSIDSLRAVERAFARACKRITTDDRDSLKNALEAVNRAEKIDGEVFVRMFPDRATGIKIQLIEPDHIPESLNYDQPTGNLVRCGIEFDPWGRVVGYYVSRRHPDEVAFLAGPNSVDFVPAREILHIFTPSRPSAVRGYPSLNSVIGKLAYLDKFEDAHLNASLRAAMADMWVSQAAEDEQQYDDDGNPITPTLPLSMGGIPLLPSGMELHVNESKFPDVNHSSVIKTILHASGAGLNLSYNNLAQDFEGVNYSSLREAKLMSKAYYKRRREYLIERFLQPLFDQWLEFAALAGLVDYALDREQISNATTWRGDGWEWIDPQKDANAIKALLDMGVVTLGEVLAERGKDLREHLAALKQEQAILAEYGLTIGQAVDGSGINKTNNKGGADTDAE